LATNIASIEIIHESTKTFLPNKRKLVNKTINAISTIKYKLFRKKAKQNKLL